jgi:FdhD protein
VSATQAARSFPAVRVAAGGAVPLERLLPEETPVALVHDGSTTAVMMATPADLEDFALGFTLTEGIAPLEAIREVEIVRRDEGIEARVWLSADSGAALAQRRRTMAGPTGCGLCGLESLEAARRPVVQVGSAVRLSAAQVRVAVASLAAAQPLGAATRAAHAAGYWRPQAGLVAAREDVGRHNALDKLAGALARTAAPRDGIVVLTSRISIEMVQKTAAIGAEVLAAVSAPTVFAVETAREAGLTLVAVARDDAFEIFTHPERING